MNGLITGDLCLHGSKNKMVKGIKMDLVQKLYLKGEFSKDVLLQDRILCGSPLWAIILLYEVIYFIMFKDKLTGDVADICYHPNLDLIDVLAEEYYAMVCILLQTE